MLSVSTFYLSRILGNKVFSDNQEEGGRLLDLAVDLNSIRPKVIAAKLKIAGEVKIIDFSCISFFKEKGRYIIKYGIIKEIKAVKEDIKFLKKHLLDKQIVDINGKKLVRVNDLRLAILANGTYAVAVDVGFDGLFRRLGIAKYIKMILKIFGLHLPSKLILWDDVASVDFSHAGIKLSKEYNKLLTLHPSDLADIIEDYDRQTQVAIFSSLDEENAADVLEELEPEAQLFVLGSLTIEKAADVLEKMPTDEIADILDEMKEEDAEKLLSEMEKETSEEVRELMEYPDNTVGSLMTTDYVSFNENVTVNEIIFELRRLKPEADIIHYLYVVNNAEKLVATVSLRDIIISEPEIKLKEILSTDIIYVHDYNKIDTLNEIISKYSLFAVPVVDENMKILGIVVINDVVEMILDSKKKRI